MSASWNTKALSAHAHVLFALVSVFPLSLLTLSAALVQRKAVLRGTARCTALTSDNHNHNSEWRVISHCPRASRLVRWKHLEAPILCNAICPRTQIQITDRWHISQSSMHTKDAVSTGDVVPYSPLRRRYGLQQTIHNASSINATERIPRSKGGPFSYCVLF